MWLVFAIQLITVLLMFQPDKSLSCDDANWWSSLDQATWSICPNTNTYLRGLYRSPLAAGDERIGRIEMGRCCTASEPSYTNQPATCSNANWLHTLDGFHVWALCPTGYYLNGLRPSAGYPYAYLQHIEEGQCCHPQGHPNSYEHCYDEDVSLSFNNVGWSECQQAGYYMTGFYKSSCNDINCIEKFRCCSMTRVVNGGWSAYGNWSECNVTCGAGQQERFRTCTNPPPSDGGAQCSGSNKETRPCDNGPCKVDGEWSDFGDWSECSAKCGGGIRTRRRTCTNPPPSNCGASCVGDNLEAESCNTNSCSVDGGWSEWSAYGKCNKPCGKSRRSRSRTCTNPPPSENGKKCRGKSKQSKRCKRKKCRGY